MPESWKQALYNIFVKPAETNEETAGSTKFRTRVDTLNNGTKEEREQVMKDTAVETAADALTVGLPFLKGIKAGETVTNTINTVGKMAMPSTLTKGMTYYFPRLTRVAEKTAPYLDAGAISLWSGKEAQQSIDSFNNNEYLDAAGHAALAAMPLVATMPNIRKTITNTTKTTQAEPHYYHQFTEFNPQTNQIEKYIEFSGTPDEKLPNYIKQQVKDFILTPQYVERLRANGVPDKEIGRLIRSMVARMDDIKYQKIPEIPIDDIRVTKTKDNKIRLYFKNTGDEAYEGACYSSKLDVPIILTRRDASDITDIHEVSHALFPLVQKYLPTDARITRQIWYNYPDYVTYLSDFNEFRSRLLPIVIKNSNKDPEYIFNLTWNNPDFAGYSPAFRKDWISKLIGVAPIVATTTIDTEKPQE